MAMSPRERVLRVVNREKPDKVPKQAGFTPAIQKLFEEKTGRTDPAVYFGMEVRHVGFKGPKVKPDFSRYFPNPPEGLAVSEYGTATVPGRVHHFTRKVFPLQHIQSVDELADYPWPDFEDPARHEDLEAQAERLHQEGWFVSGGPGHIFETAWQIRGIHEFLMDMVANPEIPHEILEQITVRNEFIARRCAEAGVDALITGDDVGMQDRLMMSPDTWRTFIKPRLKRVIDSARAVRPGLPVWYHSDGNVECIVPELIEVGVTVLNPVQPECMDPAQLKRQYGDRLAFWGTIGTQSTMPWGTPDDVRACVKQRIETVGYDGGLLLAPTHVLEPEVPWENIVAFFDAVEAYGHYA